MGGTWSYNCCFVGCCFLDLFKTIRDILLWNWSSFFSVRFISSREVHLYNSIDTATASKKPSFVLSERSDFQRQSVFSSVWLPMRMLTSLSVDEMLLPGYVNWSTNFIAFHPFMLVQFCVIPRSLFPRKGNVEPFVHFSLVFCLYTALHNRRRMSSTFLVLHTSGDISWGPVAFLLLIVFSTASSSSSVNCPSLIASWLSITFLYVYYWFQEGF